MVAGGGSKWYLSISGQIYVPICKYETCHCCHRHTTWQAKPTQVLSFTPYHWLHVLIFLCFKSKPLLSVVLIALIDIACSPFFAHQPL